MIALFAVAQLINAIRSDEERSYEISASVAVTVGIAAVLVVGYVVLMPFLGFLLATVVFLVVSMHFSGVDRVWKSVPVALGVSLALHYIFIQFLRIPLPENPFVPIGRLLPSLWYGGVGLV
ncbi:tripartite tricarboxylate transporter TctB family protein [Natrinema sp. SYSU A 869]|uniref:tripartite tricarboxylate transporter TctB family protein n=1 Tax=Natrinema sp. SYSU A 869 TaxID=2871694 RepID=UPI0021025948|nr:tripartite tricarboxylate transporter TctB family protein [Natrinema sp. SYSU A 869]